MPVALTDGNFVALKSVTGPVPIDGLNKSQVTELQVALSRLGYPVRGIDGAIGPRTRNAWAEFKTDVYPGNPDLIGPESVAILRDKLKQLATCEAANVSTKAATIQAIKNECVALGVALPTQIAYVLATTQWETAQTFKPVREAFWLSEAYRKTNFSYYPYYGRGYVQLTWDRNYKAYSDILGRDMVKNPDIALEAPIALFVLVHGFKTGTFTGRSIGEYINATHTDFVGCRRCINGNDKANEIAELAQTFLATL